MSRGKKKTPYLREFSMQKAAAKQRNLPWNLTFLEWLAFWGDDIEKRGLGSDSMVMGVRDKSIGFRKDNIYKTTKGKLIVETIQTRPNKKMRRVRTPLGDFRSVNSAAVAHEMGAMSVIYRIKKGIDGWEYIDK